MLLDLNKVPEVYIICGYTDLRKSIDGFASIIQDSFNISPMTDAIFLFCNRLKNKLKILYWAKSLKEIKMISKKQLEWLLEGLEIEQKYYHQEIKVELA